MLFNKFKYLYSTCLQQVCPEILCLDFGFPFFRLTFIPHQKPIGFLFFLLAQSAMFLYWLVFLLHAIKAACSIFSILHCGVCCGPCETKTNCLCAGSTNTCGQENYIQKFSFQAVSNYMISLPSLSLPYGVIVSALFKPTYIFIHMYIWVRTCS